MSYGIFVKTTNDNRFIDFVVSDKGKKNLRRVNTTEINAQKRAVKKGEVEAMEQSLKIAMLDLDYKARNGFPIHRDWKAVAKKVEGVSRIGG
jgi:hypothetical protein